MAVYRESANTAHIDLAATVIGRRQHGRWGCCSETTNSADRVTVSSLTTAAGNNTFNRPAAGKRQLGNASSNGTLKCALLPADIVSY